MTSQSDTPLVLRAISWAARAHHGQWRKDGCTPYVAHPFRVMTVLLTVFGMDDPELLATAVLHDCLEDTTTDYDDLEREFGARVADYVALLSKDKRKPEGQRERAYLTALATAPAEVQLCKLADVYDNLLDSQGLPAAARARKVAQARALLDMVADGLNARWPQAVARFRDVLAQVAAAQTE